MKKAGFSEKVKSLRQKKTLSQEQLAEKSGLSLRTVQRIENGETIPRGNSIVMLAAALDATPDEIMEWEQVEDTSHLSSMNLSSLLFIVFPVLGLITPLIMRLSRKDKVKGGERSAREIINFQITMIVLIVVTQIALTLLMAPISDNGGDISPTLIAGNLKVRLSFILITNLLVLTEVIVNAFRISNNKPVRYFPRIKFLR